MRNRGQPTRKAFGREFGKVDNQRYRPKLGNNISTLDLRNQGYYSIIQTRDIDNPKTETLNNATHQLFQLGPKSPKERNGKAIWPRRCIGGSRINHVPDFLIRERDHQGGILLGGNFKTRTPKVGGNGQARLRFSPYQRREEIHYMS